ncbi:MAG: hypothetical protein GDA40_04170 [Rhodobacteraceae bacterium]|nr:hypothetical protein [Paracoccaceae bacterium]
MSNRDSFIEEVKEELRRERAFTLLRKYGWIGVVAVLAIVGGTAFNEYRKAQALARAQTNGDALFAALQEQSPQARLAQLEAAQLQSEGAEVVRGFLLAAEQRQTDPAEARAILDTLAQSAPAVGGIYEQLAVLKAIALALPEQRAQEQASHRAVLEQMAQPGQPLALLAAEQLALLDIAAGDTEAALTRLAVIYNDAGASRGLRARAEQLVEALGKTPEEVFSLEPQGTPPTTTDNP